MFPRSIMFFNIIIHFCGHRVWLFFLQCFYSFQQSQVSKISVSCFVVVITKSLARYILIFLLTTLSNYLSITICKGLLATKKKQYRLAIFLSFCFCYRNIRKTKCYLCVYACFGVGRTARSAIFSSPTNSQGTKPKN